MGDWLEGCEHAGCVAYSADAEGFLSVVCALVCCLVEGEGVLRIWRRGSTYSSDDRPAIHGSSLRKSKGLPCRSVSLRLFLVVLGRRTMTGLHSSSSSSLQQDSEWNHFPTL